MGRMEGGQRAQTSIKSGFDNHRCGPLTGPSSSEGGGSDCFAPTWSRMSTTRREHQMCALCCASQGKLGAHRTVRPRSSSMCDHQNVRS